MWNNQDRVVIVAAHPDDETIGMGGQLASLPSANVTLIHVTDGAPRSRPDWKSYAQTRRAELLQAAAIAGIPLERCLEIGLPDQEASRHLVELSFHLSRLFTQLDPRLVFTHAFEGGHPDHDATAFAVHHATHRAMLFEFSSYHRNASNAALETGCFLGWPTIEPIRLELDSQQRSQKRRMLDCFSTQRETLHWFPVEHECFRRAPAYDFSEPPHPGRLFYESFDWSVNASEWVHLARRAGKVVAPCLSR